MHVHLVGPEITSADGIWNFSGVYAYFIRRELLRSGITLTFSRQSERTQFMQVPWGADHVLALGNRFFDKQAGAKAMLRRKCHGLLTQIADHGADNPSACDLTFCLKDSIKPRHVVVGWAADADWFTPAPRNGRRFILLDHPNYSSAGADRTEELAASALAEPNCDVGMVWSDGVRKLTKDGLPAGDFARGRVSYLRMASELASADVFVVTHQESLGQMALEAAMSGALVVCPRGFIASDRLKTIRHVSFVGEIPWRSVWDMVDAQASHEVAARNSWNRLVGKILKALGWKQTKP